MNFFFESKRNEWTRFVEYKKKYVILIPDKS